MVAGTHELWAQMPGVQILALLVTSYVTGQQRHLSVPPFFSLTEQDDMVSALRARFHNRVTTHIWGQ